MMKKLLATYVLGSCLFVTMAMAHDTQMRKSMYSDWMEHLQSHKGLCCTQNEGSTVKDVDWSVSDGMTCVITPIEEAIKNPAHGKYCVRIEETWYYVPDAAVIEESNKYGPAVVWPIWRREGGQLTTKVDGIRCFMPGAFT